MALTARDESIFDGRERNLFERMRYNWSVPCSGKRIASKDNSPAERHLSSPKDGLLFQYVVLLHTVKPFFTFSGGTLFPPTPP